MQAEIDRRIEEYFSDAGNLHRLRAKLLRLEEYVLKSDVDKERAALQKEKADAIAALEEQQREVVEQMTAAHQEALKKMTEEHQEALRQVRQDHAAEVQRVQAEFAGYRTEVGDQLQEAERVQQELVQWRSDYGELAAVYAKYRVLSEKRREAIAGIFGGCDTPLAFFCGALQKGHLEQLWDYVSDELAMDATEDFEAAGLASLFDFSLDAVNRSQREPLFRRLSACMGAAFDGDTMGRTAKSPQLGSVARLVFAGFAHVVTGRVVRRSLVDLG